MDKIQKTEEEWKKTLTAGQYRVLRKKGTEAPFSGRYHASREKGMYVCAACGQKIFSSETKFDSATGWPSFYSPAHESSVQTIPDLSLSMSRIEVVCSRCGSHLGHVFDDGPQPTGKRFCINSCALDLKKDV